MSIDPPLDTMTVAEKVQLLETVWASLCHETGDVQSPEWHRAVLEERTRRLTSGEATVSSLHDAFAFLADPAEDIYKATDGEPFREAE